MTRTLTALFLFSFMVLYSSSSFANDNKAKASQEFEAGNALFAQERYLEAAAAFRRANELRPNWRLLYNIAQCEAASKLYGMALEHFERYLSMGGDDIPLERSESVLREVRKLRLMVGFVDIKGTSGATVDIDGFSRGSLPLLAPITVSAGVEHTLIVRVKGVPVLEKVILVRGGKTAVFRVEGHQASPATATPSDDTTPQETTADSPKQDVASDAPEKKGLSPLSIAGISTMGVGGGVLIGGLVTGVLSLNIKSELEPLCETSGCPSEKKADRDKMLNLAKATDIMIGVGATLAAGGLTIFLVSKLIEKKERQTVSVLPVFTDDFAGATVSGRF